MRRTGGKREGQGRIREVDIISMVCFVFAVVLVLSLERILLLLLLLLLLLTSGLAYASWPYP